MIYITRVGKVGIVVVNEDNKHFARAISIHSVTGEHFIRRNDCRHSSGGLARTNKFMIMDLKGILVTHPLNRRLSPSTLVMIIRPTFDRSVRKI